MSNVRPRNRSIELVVTPKQPPWLNPSKSPYALQFPVDQARRNFELLRQLLGPKFLSTVNQAPRYIRHPIIQKWISSSPDSYLHLNALAEDLRVVAEADGIQHVLADLRDVDRCNATWHALHVAALFGRAQGAKVDRFFPQTDESLPDFHVSTPVGSFACEAKALASSGTERAFGDYARQLSSRIEQVLMNEDQIYPVITVVVKDSESPPPPEQVISAIRIHLNQYDGSQVSFRSNGWNAFLDPVSRFAEGFSQVRAINVLGKRSEKEDLRVHRHGKQASKQLSGIATREVPGLLALAIGDLQEPEFLEAMFRRRFSAGDYSGLSAAVLIRSGTHTGPPTGAPLDLVAVIPNDEAALKMPPVRLQPVGLLGRLRDANPKPHVAAYRYQMIQGKVLSEGTNCMLGIPDLRWLTPDMLAD
jgi:hypothetical protein